MNLRQLQRILQQMLWLPVLSLLLVSLILVLQIRSAVTTVLHLQQADRNIETARYINQLVLDEETGLRGYENTSDEVFLQPYDQAARPLGQAFRTLRDGLVATHTSPAALDRLVETQTHWQTDVAIPTIVALRTRTGLHDTTTDLRGKMEMDDVRAQTAALIENQRQLRDQAAERWRWQVRRTFQAVVGLLVILGFGLGVFFRAQLHHVSAAFSATLEALRRHSQRVNASEQRLRTILTSIGDAVVVCNVDGRVDMLNIVAQQLTGWTQEEAQGKPLRDVFHIVHETTREPLETPVDAVKREHRIISLSNHAVLIRRDGTELNIDDSASPVLDPDGRLNGVVMVFRDITESRQRQGALLASEKQAVAGRLAATIAHEIHNPLDAAINLIYLLRTSAEPEERAEFLDLASRELERVSQISHAMLSMYRESRTPVAVDLTELLESLLLLLERALMQGGITVLRHLEPGCVVTGYPAELRQVFTNLLTNALDASPSGSTIEVTARRSTPPDAPGVTVRVTDHGAGIPADVLPRLFQPFFTTKGEHGTGLGLWISQGILQKHGGNIRLDARVGNDHGTSAIVFLPRGEAPLTSTHDTPFHASEPSRRAASQSSTGQPQFSDR